MSDAGDTGGGRGAILAPHQFQLPAPPPDGPRVLGIHSSATAGPFGGVSGLLAGATTLDGTLRSDPPWGVSTRIPYGAWSGDLTWPGRSGTSAGHGARRASGR